MLITDALARKRPFFSFEFFPPKDEDGARALFSTIEALLPLQPAFVSITYGAGGSTRSRTVELAKRINDELQLTVMAHVTCLGQSRRELRELFDDLANAGIENVLALRGDAPADGSVEPGAFEHASEMIAMLAKNYPFCIGAACYPESHVESPDWHDDLAHLKRKVDAGAQFLISQLFFDNREYAAFIDRAREHGIDVPILPGLMPITNFDQIARFTKMCGATIPPKLRREMESRRGDRAAIEDLGVAYAALQATELFTMGVPGIHFYTLNKSPATRAVVSAILAASAWTPTFSASTPR